MTATCSGCGSRFKINEHSHDYEPWMPPLCAECALAEEAGEIRAVLQSGDVRRAAEMLAEHVSYPPPIGGKEMVAGLMYEAADYLRRGDAEEAAYRLRVAAQPKWSSIEECKEQYRMVMSGEAA